MQQALLSAGSDFAKPSIQRFGLNWWKTFLDVSMWQFMMLRFTCSCTLPRSVRKCAVGNCIGTYIHTYVSAQRFSSIKGTNPALKKPSNIPEIYAKMFGRIHWSRLSVFTQKFCVMWKILMFEISAKKGLCYVICSSEVKTSDLAAHFHTILALQIRFCLLFKRSTNIQGWQS